MNTVGEDAKMISQLYPSEQSPNMISFLICILVATIKAIKN